MERERSALVAIVGMTTYGIALLSYFVNRSSDEVLLHVSLPAILVAALWLSLLVRHRAALPRDVTGGATAFALAVSVVLVAVAWSSVGDRFPRSALAHAAPGGSSLQGALQRLWHMPPLSPSSPEGVALLKRYMPGEHRSLVLTQPDLATEIFLRSGRGDRLFLGDAVQTSFVAKARLGDLQGSLRGLRAGDRLLMDRQAQLTLAILRRRPTLDPLQNSYVAGVLPRELSTLQQWALKWMDQHFTLRVIHGGPQGLAVAELGPKPAAGG
jgi:hypothetical protein